jgi:hypothetical protein
MFSSIGKQPESEMKPSDYEIITEERQCESVEGFISSKLFCRWYIVLRITDFMGFWYSERTQRFVMGIAFLPQANLW